MNEIDAKLLLKNIKRSLRGLANEVPGTPPPDIQSILMHALNTIILSPGTNRDLPTRPHSLKIINLQRGPEHATSLKIRNALVRPVDWLDIGWKAAGLAAAVPIFGAWTGVGLVLVLRDLLKVFNIDLSLMQGQILHILAEAQSNGLKNIPVPTLRKRVNKVYDNSYKIEQIRNCLMELSKLKCITLEKASDSVRLIEEVKV
jgi:hypothetical protein